MEGGDLVVVQVGGHERLRGEHVRQFPHLVQADAQALEPRPVGTEILADGRHRDRILAQQLEVVGDVAGAAAELAAHLRHQEGHVQDVHLVRQDVVLEMVLEHHDGVVGQGTADQGRHGAASGRRGRRGRALGKVGNWPRAGAARGIG
jgi:hypothetical protein